MLLVTRLPVQKPESISPVRRFVEQVWSPEEILLLRNPFSGLDSPGALSSFLGLATQRLGHGHRFPG